MTDENGRPYIDFDLVAPEACRAQGCRWTYTTTDPDFVLVITHNDGRVLELIAMVSPDDWRVRNWLVQQHLADEDLHGTSPS
jgi:hypothetical protein